MKKMRQDQVSVVNVTWHSHHPNASILIESPAPAFVRPFDLSCLSKSLHDGG